MTSFYVVAKVKTERKHFRVGIKFSKMVIGQKYLELELNETKKAFNPSQDFFTRKKTVEFENFFPG